MQSPDDHPSPAGELSAPRTTRRRTLQGLAAVFAALLCSPHSIVRAAPPPPTEAPAAGPKATQGVRCSRAIHEYCEYDAQGRLTYHTIALPDGSEWTASYSYFPTASWKSGAA